MIPQEQILKVYTEEEAELGHVMVIFEENGTKYWMCSCSEAAGPYEVDESLME